LSEHRLTRADLEELFPELVLTVEDVATRLGLHTVTVTRAIKRRDLAALHGLGRPYRMTRSAVIAWLLGSERPDAAAPPSADRGPVPGERGAASAATDASERRPPAPRKVSPAALSRRRSMRRKRRPA
jgi:excisionase family DNA binding protein